MKTVQYDLRIIHRKKVAIGAINRKEIDRILRDMITSGEALNMEGGEVVGIVVEEKGERDCPGDCDHCPYLCPENEDCMMDDLEDRCRSCEYGCEKCGTCSLIDYGVCGDEECESCHWRCPECGGCTHPEGERRRSGIHNTSKQRLWIARLSSGSPAAACQGKIPETL